ncbi:MAG: hypothetical protein IPN46_20105 [Saprospiraceae bacterium]|nr:hypothetical protein [Saprospiraceae bacterium]
MFSNNLNVFGQTYEAGVTESPGAGTGIQAWVGLNKTIQILKIGSKHHGKLQTLIFNQVTMMNILHKLVMDSPLGPIITLLGIDLMTEFINLVHILMAFGMETIK